MMKTLADGLAILQADVRGVHASGKPEQRRTLPAMVEMLREDAFGPITTEASLLRPLGQLLAIARRYAATRPTERAQQDACVAEFEIVLFGLASAAEHAKLDPARIITRPDFDASPAPNPIGA